MSSKRCPKCRTSDYYIDPKYDVCCGYCGFVVGNIKESYISARKTLLDEKKLNDSTGLMDLAGKK